MKRHLGMEKLFIKGTHHIEEAPFEDKILYPRGVMDVTAIKCLLLYIRSAKRTLSPTLRGVCYFGKRKKEGKTQ